MADYYILDAGDDLQSVRVAYHIPVPVEQNQTNTSSLREALAEDPDINKDSVVPWVLAAEQAKLDNGELYEHVEIYKTHNNHALAADKAAIDARFAQLSTAVVNKIRKRYAYWGYEGGGA